MVANIDKLIPLTDPTDDWRVRTTLTGQKITMYGQVSQAFLGYDDGLVRNTFVPVDNSNASTRVGFLWQLYPVFGLNAVARFEGGITPRASNAMSQLDSSGSGFSFDGTHVRKLELILDSARFGTLSFGQGSTATDSIAEIDLSQTKVTAYSAVSQTAGGQYLRLANGSLSTLVIGNVFDNFDGDNVTGYNSDGSRKLRIRYDSPSFKGFKFSAAAGKDTVTNNPATHLDMALRYEGKFDKFQFSGGIGYSDHEARKVTSGSLSALHYDTGVNITVALGSENASGDYTYVKLGLIREIVAAGDTAFSFDYYDGKGLGVAGSSSRSYGLAVSQQIKKKNIEIFGLIRRYEYADPTNLYKPSVAVLAGVRWKF
ncbi:porin [uncultured Shimia sp.]|uniref:porin n=1 Tax=uncultured Shimia sp. TaxID=573152 RepID=UPI0026272031|nr:porin [uncultured Shimia sp.]